MFKKTNYICVPMILRTLSLIITALLFLLSSLGFGQISEDFSDGDFTNIPTWTGDDSLFRINPNFELQLNDTNASGSNESYLSTPSKSIKNAVWEFKFQIANTTSSQNYIKAFLVCNQRDVSGNVNGYYVQLGNTPDEVSLYKTSSGTNSKIIDGRDGITGKSSTQGWIKVTRDSLGNWKLFSDTSKSKTGYVSEGTVNDGSFTQTEYFGFLCRYSSTRNYASYFDSIKVSGKSYGDTTKPYVLGYEVLDSIRIKVQFSEKVEPVSALDKDNYLIGQPSILPHYRDTTVAYVGTDTSQVIYTFLDAIGIYGLNEFVVLNVKDFLNNKLVPFRALFSWPVFYTAKKEI